MHTIYDAQLFIDAINSEKAKKVDWWILRINKYDNTINKSIIINLITK